MWNISYFRTVGRYLGLLLLLGIFLNGCDEKNAELVATQHTETQSPPTEVIGEERAPAVIPKYSREKLDNLAKRYANKPLTIDKVSVTQLEGASALVISFSVPVLTDNSFSRLVSVVDKQHGKVDGAWELSDDLMDLRLRYLEPNRTLVITINEGIRAVNGEYLTLKEKGKIYELTTPDMPPSVGFASKGSLLPTKLLAGLPVISLNIESVDVDFFRIKQSSLASFLSKWTGKSSFAYWESSQFTQMADLVYSGRFDLNPRANTRETIQLPLKGIKPLQEAGVYFAVMRQAGDYSNYNIPATVFTLSDIGLSVHSYYEQMDVFAQALEGGNALAKVELALLDNKGAVLAEAVTDKQGHAKLEKQDKAVLLLATHQGQTSAIALNQPALDLSEFDIAGPKGYNIQLFAFGPRDLYRPGETVLVNALLRDGNGKSITDRPINVDVLKADQQVVRSFLWQPENGFYQYQYVIPTSAETGQWSLRMNIGDNQPRFYSFKVEDFLPERMALEIKTEGSQVLTPDATTMFTVNGRYLYGAPAAGNRLIYQAYLQPNRHAVAKLPGFEFGSVTETDLSQRLLDTEQNLDNDGKASITISSRWEKSKSPLKVVLQASLQESGGRAVSRRAEQVIWPAEVLPGIRPLFSQKEIYDYRNNRYAKQYVIDEDSLAEFDIVYTDSAGNKLATKEELTVQLIYERRDYYWRWSDAEGWRSEYSSKDLVMDTTAVSLTAEMTQKVSFPVEWGTYRLEVLDPSNNIMSSIRFWAGYSWQDNTQGTGAVRPDQVKMRLDKAAYSPGEKVNLHVEAPAAGKGYLLVESSDGPLWWQEIEVPVGGANFQIPLHKEWVRHDIYLSTLIIRPGDKQQQLTPKRAIGVLHLPLAEEKRRIELALQAPTKVEPNDTLTVKIKGIAQQNQVGKPITVLVSAVDVGILNITNYRTPDPYESFLGRKRYNVDQFDVYAQLIEGKGKLASLRFGGDGDGSAPMRGGKKPVTQVTIVALQAKTVELNEQGEGTVTFNLPDFNGELRLMAQAWTDQEFGQAEGKVTVAAPVIVELATPRFMAGEDTSKLALDITNLSGEKQSMTLSVVANGLVSLVMDSHLAEQQVVLNDQQKSVLYLPVLAQNGFGEGEVTVTLSGVQVPNKPAKSYQRSWKIGVRPAVPAETRHFATILRSGEEWKLPFNALNGLAPNTLEGQLLLSSRPPLNLAQNIKELYAYPYGCSEQTTSGLFPSLYVHSDRLKALGIKTETDEQRRENINIGISRLLAMQRFDGSFGLWSKSGDEEPWLTVYVTDFLFRAKEMGYQVPDDALNQAVSRLQRYLLSPYSITTSYSNNEEYSRFAVQAYAGLVLARQQQASLSALREVYERRENAISGLSEMQLGIALQLMGDQGRANNAIASSLKRTRVDKLYINDYGSQLRDDALMLALMYEYRLQPKQRDNRLLTLSDSLHDRSYLSTQERNALVMAGRYLMDEKETRWSAELVSMTTQSLMQNSAVTVNLSAEQLDYGLLLTSTSPATLYPRLDITGYPHDSVQPIRNVLNIERRFLDSRGNPIKLDAVKSGDLIYVYLKVSAKDQEVNDALVVDFLPAGFELENQNLSDSSVRLSDSMGELRELLGNMQRAKIEHQEFRDDRYVAAVRVSQYRATELVYLARAVTPGSYQVPPPMVESMYRPDWRAVGGSVGVITIQQ